MNLSGPAEQVCIYLGERSKIGLLPTSTAILDFLRSERIAGATILRGSGGYGPHSLAQSERQLSMSEDGSVMVVFVDSPERVAKVMPRIKAMVRNGLITRQVIEVVKYTRAVSGSFPDELTVADIMTRDVVTIMPNATVEQIVTLLIRRALRALPVIDADGLLVGMITDGDLLHRGGVMLPISEPGLSLSPDTGRQRAFDLMTKNPIAIQATSKLAEVAAMLVTHDLKRMPVLDLQGRLVGMISRSDLLGTVVESKPAREDLPQVRGERPQQVSDVMIHDVPTIGRDGTLPEVIDALMRSKQRRAVVIDAQRHVLGIISDGDVMRRAARHVPANTAGGIRGWLGGGQRPATVELPDTGLRADQLMTHPARTVRSDTPIPEAIATIMSLRVKRLPVVDSNGRLVGLVGRAGLLQALTREENP